jgi:quinol monooxygenase YgiN
MIHLIITVTTHQGRVPEYVAAFASLAPRVRLEEGCLEYDLYRDSTDPRFDNEVRPDTVVICEKWENIDALLRHNRNSAPLAEFRKRVKDIKLQSQYRLLTPVTNQ